jgi:lysophospholipase L1-like esterase
MRAATPTVADGTAPADPAAPVPVPEPTPAAPATIARAGSVGALENTAALKRFFDALARLEEGRAHDDVRVVQFGDSHTAADFETGPLRRALQSRFGDGGRGFVAIGHVYPKWVQEGLRVGNTRDFASERGKWSHGKFVGDGMYGLAGASIETSQHGARAWAELMTKAPRLELSYLEQPRGGSFDVYVDGGRLARVSTSGRSVASAFRAFDVADAAHHVEVRAVGDGDVRLFGMTIDRPEAGIVLDALGINGARVTTALQWSEAHMAEQLRHRSPDLVVLAYGTNEAGDDTPAATYERQLVDLLGRVARAVPTSACLLLGPPDRAAKSKETGMMMTMPKLLEVIETQRRVARAAGCAYYSQFDAMGGAGTIAAWANEVNSRAQKDYVHLTRDGYAYLANAFAGDLVRAYSGWRIDQGMAPSSVTVPVPVAPSPTPVPAATATPVPIANRE